jgi:hypothetical protein
MAAPSVRKFPDNSLERQIYNLVDAYKENIPVANDRNRLAYSLFKFVKGEGDSPAILVKTTKIRIEGISSEELAGKLISDLENLKED